MKEIVSAIIGAAATLVGVVLAFYLANRLALNDSMDSKSGWRKELMDIASKDKITLADIYRIRASVRYYPHQTPTRLSFRWMTNLIIKLCDEYFVGIYKDKRFRIYECENGDNLTSKVIVSPENDEIVRIICRYLLKYHWEARQKMRIFRRGRDLMNINDDDPSEAAARTIQLILEQVEKMNNNDSSKDIKKIIDKTLSEAKCYESESKCFKDKVYAFVWLSVAMLILSLAYTALHIDKGTEITTSGKFKIVIENFHIIYKLYCGGPLFYILIMFFVILLIFLFCNCCSSSKK